MASEPLYSVDTLSAGWSALLVFVALALSFGYTSVVVVRTLRARRLAALAEAQQRAAVLEETPLEPGPAAVHGVVELARGATSAVRLVVVQHGSEVSKDGKVTHRWSERERRVEAQPFYLRQSTGSRLRVEPPSDLVFDDEVDRFEPTGPRTRNAIAELTAGEEVTVVGKLVAGSDPEALGSERGYREAGTGLVLRDPPAAPMRISTQPLGKKYRGLASLRGLGAALGSLHLVLLCGFAMPYLGRLVFGQTVPAEIVGKRIGTEKRKGKTYDVHFVDVKASTGERFSEEIDEHDFARVSIGQRLDARAASPFGFPQLGPDPGVNAGIPIAALVSLIPLFVFTFLVWRQKDTIDHGGEGPLSG